MGAVVLSLMTSGSIALLVYSLVIDVAHEVRMFCRCVSVIFAPDTTEV